MLKRNYGALTVIFNNKTYFPPRRNDKQFGLRDQSTSHYNVIHLNILATHFNII